MKKTLLIVTTVIVCLGLLVIAILFLAEKRSRLTGDLPNDPVLIKQGAYVAIEGDCAACHTLSDDKAFAGGLKMPIPMLGNIYASNITPDKKTGIGNWSLADFDNAMRYGISKDSGHLYPAMPYVSFSKMSDGDIKALYAYFKYGVPAVNQSLPTSNIHWPLNIRWPLMFWNALFAPNTPYQPKKNQTAAWNRGAYLVQGAAHCGTCHTPRGLFMQEKALDDSEKNFLAGSTLAGWQAFNITSDQNSGIGQWTHPQIIQYLTTGNVPNKAQAAGPMGEAIEHDFSKLTAEDVSAMTTYIQSVPAVSSGSTRPRDAWGAALEGENIKRGVSLAHLTDPKTIFLAGCAKCHNPNGLGSDDHFYPSLVHNSTVGAQNSNNLIQVILHGVHRKTPSDPDEVDMPAFDEKLSDVQIAGLTNYLIQQFGNPKTPSVTVKEVSRLRSTS